MASHSSRIRIVEAQKSRPLLALKESKLGVRRIARSLSGIHFVVRWWVEISFLLMLQDKAGCK
jgi:hypothetical protein